MDLLTLLRATGPDIWDSKIKLVRHADSLWDLDAVLRSGYLLDYERRQSRPVLDECAYVMSFFGERGTRSRFLGCRRVAGRTEPAPPFPAAFPHPDMPPGTFLYDLAPVTGFEDLEGRLIIDWGGATRAWVQRLDPKRPKRVIELLPVGHIGDFPGYDDVLLSYEELCRVVRNPEANRTWHLLLGAVAGVYLITDTKRGDQYVGSAYGEGGILARWRGYARTCHGGNERLRRRIAEDPGCEANFQFTILRTLPISMTQREVCEVETLYKRKLGSRAHGLNAN